jgi:hypothetical protein
MKQKWVSVFGHVNVTESEISFSPEISSSLILESIPVIPHALLRSNIEFEQGSISLDVKILEPESKCIIGIGCGQGGEIFTGLNNLGATYGFAIYRDSRWEPLGGSGHGSKVTINEWHELQFRVKGSNLEFHFDGVNVLSATHHVQKKTISLLLQGSACITVRNIQIKQELPGCFVVMQFTDEYNDLYKDVILPICESFGYTVFRGDDSYVSNLIIDDITRFIQEATIIIADITPNNSNVYYEVGYAHGLGKPTILLSDRKREKLPFDISGFRALFYDNTIGGKRAMEEQLKKYLRSIDS